MTFQPEAVRAFEHAGWQRAAARYNDTFAHATAPFVAPLLDAAGVSADKRVLDVACGPGHVAAAAAARGAVAQGLDFSAAMADLARTIHPDITVTEGDAEDMPHAEGAFDAVNAKADEADCDYRTAAYTIAISRVADACRLKGLFP